jgi:putative glutamine amidotransferase
MYLHDWRRKTMLSIFHSPNTKEGASPMSKTPEPYKPRILVLEGLAGDTCRIIDDAGGDAWELVPWEVAAIERELESGKYDGLVLTGGSDIDPALYGEAEHPEVYGIDTLRDTAELYALAMAEDLGIPVLGICRGSQIMCASQGGKLTQHITGHRGGEHTVYAARDARTFRRAINSREMEVVSLHHQCIRRPGRGMRIAAVAADGTPEAIESKDGRMLGVQFHPEMAAYENANAWAIFQWLVAAAARYAGVKAPRVNFREVKRASRTWTRYTPAKAAAPTACDTPKANAVPSHRPAGTRTFRPSEGSATLNRIEKADEDYGYDPGGHVCPHCAMIFDWSFDCEDHVKFIHEGVPFPDAAARYPELEPPKGHPAWDDEVMPGTAIAAHVDKWPNLVDDDDVVMH